MELRHRLAWLAASAALLLLLVSPSDGVLPTPTPAAKATGIVAVIVEDRITPAEANVAAQLRKYFDADPTRKLFVLDADDVDENGNKVARRFIALAAPTPPPFVQIFADDTLLATDPLPTDAAAFIARVEAFGK